MWEEFVKDPCGIQLLSGGVCFVLAILAFLSVIGAIVEMADGNDPKLPFCLFLGFFGSAAIILSLAVFCPYQLGWTLAIVSGIFAVYITLKLIYKSFIVR